MYTHPFFVSGKSRHLKKEFSILIVSRTDLLKTIVGSRRLANIGAQKLGYMYTFRYAYTLTTQTV